MAEWTIASDCKSDARRATEVRILSCPPYKKRKSELARANPDFFRLWHKDDAVVEYALSRSLSPAMVADYTLHLPKKEILANKLRELADLADEDK